MPTIGEIAELAGVEERYIWQLVKSHGYVKPRRVVVTGIGMVTPYGLKEATWDALLQGESCIKPIAGVELRLFPEEAKIGGQVDESFLASYFPDQLTKWEEIPEDYPEKSIAGFLAGKSRLQEADRFARLIALAALYSWHDSGINLGIEDNTRVGCCIGSGFGGHESYEQAVVDRHDGALTEKQLRKRLYMMVPKTIANIAAFWVQHLFDIHGACSTLVSACATGLENIADAAMRIALGYEDMMFAGGGESSFVKSPTDSFYALRAMYSPKEGTTYRPEQCSRPCDINRNGFVLSEGAAVLLLEEEQHALSRGARIYARIAGSGKTGDAYSLTASYPDGKYVELCMRRALEDAGIAPDDIDYANLHLTATPDADPNEIKAISRLFQERVYASATKSLWGHMLGGAGAAAAGVTALSLYEQRVHGTINLEQEDPECAYERHLCSLHGSLTGANYRDMEIRNAIVNAFGFGGPNVSVVLSKK